MAKTSDDKLFRLCRTALSENSPLWEQMGLTATSQEKTAMLNGMILMARFLGNEEAAKSALMVGDEMRFPSTQVPRSNWKGH